MRSADSSEARGSNAPTQNSRLPEQTGGIRRSIGRTIWKLFGGKEENNREKKNPLLPEQLTGMDILRWAQENGIGQEDIKPAGTLIEQGEPASSVYILLDGAARIEHTLDEERYYLATLPQDSVVGEISALTDSQTTASVSLLKPTRVLEISAAQFKLIADDPVLKERVESMISKRLLVTADFRDRLLTYLEEKEAERMHTTPNAEMAKKLSLSAAIADGLAEGSPVTYPFKISYMVDKVLGTKDLTIRYTKLSHNKGYAVAIVGEGVSIGMIFSANGKEVSQMNSKITDQNAKGGGLYTRIFRYLLRDVAFIYSNIIETNTSAFVWDRGRNVSDVAHSELAAHSPVTAAKKGFISNIDEIRGLSSYRVDTELAMILDIATDLERALRNKDESLLQKIYGIGAWETAAQLRDLMEEYRQSPEYAALPEEARYYCDLQTDRIENLPKEMEETGVFL